MRTLTSSLLLAFTLACSCARAAPFESNITVLSNDIAYDIRADGTFTRQESERFRINTDQGVKNDSQMALHYSTSLETLEIEEAYTTTPQGERLDVAPDKIIEQQSRESAAAPMFDDGKVKTVVFPRVEIGSVLTLRIRKTQKQALFPNQFSASEYFGNDIARNATRVTVRAPASLPLHADAIGLTGGRVSGGDSAVQLWRWALPDAPARAPELGSVSSGDYSPRLALTTFPDFASAGAAYEQRAVSKAAVTPAIRELAERLTRGVSEPRAQAEILYNWVSAHIRYVAIYLDFGGVVPHDADTILRSGYGDCKDHVSILQALLAAKGIASSPVLVNAGRTYWLPSVAAPLAVFDHAITYLPDFDLFIDSTASVARFGTLPSSELGKPALITNAPGGARIVTLPLGTPENASTRVTTRVSLDGDGNARGAATIDNAGVLDYTARQLFASLPPGVEPQVANRMLTLTGQSGTGSYQHGDPRDLSQPFAYSTAFKLSDYTPLPGPGAMQVPLGLGSFSSIASAFDQCEPDTRDYAIPVTGRHVAETTIITLPDDIRITHVPKPARVTSPLGRYTSGYRIEGRTVTVTRELDITPPGPLVGPDRYPAFKQLAMQVKRDLRNQLVYEPAR
jgi:transglutaminase-like putative cysteine protease